MNVTKSMETCKRGSFSEFVDRFIDECRCGRLGLKSKRPYAQNTIEVFREARRALVEFGQARSMVVNFDDVTPAFFDDMARYFLIERAAPRQVMKRNSVHRIIAILKTMMRVARRECLHDNTAFERDKYSITREEVDHVYLTCEQVDELYGLDFDDHETLCRLVGRIADPRERAHMARLVDSRHRREICRRYAMYRDEFVAGCLTGQRWSDYSRIDYSMVCQMEGYKFVCLTQVKTKKKVYIPMEQRLEDIMARNGGRVPRTCDYRLNARIKEIGLLLGWTHSAGLHGGRDSSCMLSGKRFCDCLSTHTARRTWATNAYKAHVPLSSIMAVTGHSSEAMLRKYLKLNEVEMGVCAARDLQKVMHLA